MKLAFCITCKGRTQHLERTLERNIRDNLYSNTIFVLLDYNSNDGLHTYVRQNFDQYIQSGVLVYYNHNDAVTFKMAHAKNMAHRCAMLEGADILVNLDADNLTNYGFSEYLMDRFEISKKDPQEIFLWSRMIKGVMPRGVSGRIAMTRNAFLISGGYDEKYTTHSPDDKDINVRLRRLGYCAQEIDSRFLSAIPHNDKMRYKEYPQAKDSTNFEICPISRVVNNGNIGCGTVYRNFNSTPTELKPLPTRIFGIGMHKTATTSLCAALRILRFESGHWGNAHWAKAVWTEMKHLGRSVNLERFYALTDTPIPQLYGELDNSYPGSKFILTIRDEQEWLRSVKNHFDSDFNQFSIQWDNDPFTHKIHNHIYGRKTFDADTFLAVYRRHNSEVIEYFKDRPNDLLMVNVSGCCVDYWTELCKFLNVPIPDCAFPEKNATNSKKVEVTSYYS